MMSIFKGSMPDITPPQVAALLIGGIPIIAELLRAFGIYDLNIEQQQALSNVVTWASVLAGALIGGDALLRTGRNLRQGQVEAQLAAGGEVDTLKISERVVKPTATTVVTEGRSETTTGFEETTQS
jgi:hypothetical protein